MNRQFKLFLGFLILFAIFTGCGGNKKQKNGNGESMKQSITVQPLQSINEEGIGGSDKGLFREYQDNYLGFCAKVEDGKVLLHFDATKMQEQQIQTCIPDDAANKSYPVEGLSGKCVGLFVAHIGQDYNPILCMLMENGSVEILSLFNVFSGKSTDPDLLSSGPLTELNNTVSFESGGGGEYVDEGDTIYSYNTIYGIKDSGERQEVELFNRGGAFARHIEADGTIHRITLSSDWKITYAAGWSESELSDVYKGRFCQISHNDDYDFFELTYEMLQHTDFSDIENSRTAAVSKRGEFSLNRKEFDGDIWEITTKSGFDFGSKKGEKLIFKNMVE